METIPHKAFVTLAQESTTKKWFLHHSMTGETLRLPFAGDWDHELCFDENGFGYVSFDPECPGTDGPVWVVDLLREQFVKGDSGDRYISYNDKVLARGRVLKFPRCWSGATTCIVRVTLGIPPTQHDFKIAHFERGPNAFK